MRGLKRAARGWCRAIMHRGAVRQATAKLVQPTRVEPSSRQAWSNYRRTSNEWQPPPTPEYRRQQISGKQKQRKRAREALKKRLACTCRHQALPDLAEQDTTSFGQARVTARTGPIRRGGAAQTRKRLRTTAASETARPGAYASGSYMEESKGMAKPSAAPRPWPGGMAKPTAGPPPRPTSSSAWT